MLGFGLASSAVLQGRIVGRRGRSSLAVVAAVFALVAIALIVAGTQGGPAFVLAPLGLGVGACCRRARRSCEGCIRLRSARVLNSSEACSRSIPP
jgi:predicted MFS family arabinose efflux permease